MNKELYLAGGCFWGLEKYLQDIKGVAKTEVGYANGTTTNPTYDEVCHHNTGHAEVVKAEYDSDIISLAFMLSLFYDAIDPTSKNRQGGDIGRQYRTGIYYTDQGDREAILNSISELQQSHKKPIAIEVLPLDNYTKAEEYHQKYLDKNPSGYCHIGRDKFEKSKLAVDPLVADAQKSPPSPPLPTTPPNKEELRKILTPLQFAVTQQNATEPPFQNEYYNHFEKGIYADITTGEALFVSTDKFDSGCGWPAFSKPINKAEIVEIADTSHGMVRTEVRSKLGDAHLGHIFNDGPKDLGGMRYCINSATLKFIPRDDMEKQGYKAYLPLIK